MITLDQIKAFSKKYRINQTLIYREYLQLLWLSNFYKFEESSQVFFKGGTAIHLIYKAPRFSEDLDFTVQISQNDLKNLVERTFKEVSREAQIEIKERKVLAGKTFLLTDLSSVLNFKAFVKLDFSFREKVLKPSKSTLETGYPVLFTTFIHHLTKEEILAEKMRAITTREKGRDLYDLWYLLTQGTKINDTLIKEKLMYYKLGSLTNKDILEKALMFDKKKFINDLSPFIPEDERPRLPELFEVIINYLKIKLTK